MPTTYVIAQCASCDQGVRSTDPSVAMAWMKQHRKDCSREIDKRHVKFLLFTEQEVSMN